MILFYILISIITIGYFLVYVIVMHRILLRWIPYRWIVNSIIYPVMFYRIKKKSKSEKVLIYANWTHKEFWFLKFWFGKRIKNYLENYLVENVINK